LSDYETIINDLKLRAARSDWKERFRAASVKTPRDSLGEAIRIIDQMQNGEFFVENT
jgi:hypothetical protein